MNAITESLSHPFVLAIGWALVHFLWQGALICGALAIALVLSRDRSPNLRYLLSTLALMIMALLPAATLARLMDNGTNRMYATDTTYWSHESSSTHTSSSSDKLDPVQTHTPSHSTFFQPAASPSSLFSRFAPIFQSHLPMFVLAWMAGVALLSLRLLGGWWRVRRMIARQVIPGAAEWQRCLLELVGRMRLRRSVRLLESTLIQAPMTMGWLRPVILIPHEAMKWLIPEQVRALLAHELAHIRRNDYLVNLLQMLIETLLFYHPAVWWVSRTIRLEREQCTDQLAASICDNPVVLARALAMLEQHRQVPEPALSAHGGELMSRIQCLVNQRAHASLSARRTVGLFGLLFVVLLTLGLFSNNRAESKTTISAPTVFEGAVVWDKELTLHRDTSSDALVKKLTMRFTNDLKQCVRWAHIYCTVATSPRANWDIRLTLLDEKGNVTQKLRPQNWTTPSKYFGGSVGHGTAFLVEHVNQPGTEPTRYRLVFEPLRRSNGEIVAPKRGDLERINIADLNIPEEYKGTIRFDKPIELDGDRAFSTPTAAAQSIRFKKNAEGAIEARVTMIAQLARLHRTTVSLRIISQDGKDSVSCQDLFNSPFSAGMYGLIRDELVFSPKLPSGFKPGFFALQIIQSRVANALLPSDLLPHSPRVANAVAPKGQLVITQSFFGQDNAFKPGKQNPVALGLVNPACCIDWFRIDNANPRQATFHTRYRSSPKAGWRIKLELYDGESQLLATGISDMKSTGNANEESVEEAAMTLDRAPDLKKVRNYKVTLERTDIPETQTRKAVASAKPTPIPLQRKSDQHDTLKGSGALISATSERSAAADRANERPFALDQTIEIEGEKAFETRTAAAESVAFRRGKNNEMTAEVRMVVFPRVSSKTRVDVTVLSRDRRSAISADGSLTNHRDPSDKPSAVVLRPTLKLPADFEPAWFVLTTTTVWVQNTATLPAATKPIFEPNDVFKPDTKMAVDLELTNPQCRIDWFRIDRSDPTRVKCKASFLSYPQAPWRITLQLYDKQGRLMTAATGEIENSGTVKRNPQSETKEGELKFDSEPVLDRAAYYNLRLARPELDDDARFTMRHLSRLKYEPYTVQRGDTLDSIARAISHSPEAAKDILRDEPGKNPRVGEGRRQRKPGEVKLKSGEKLLVPMSPENSLKVKDFVINTVMPQCHEMPFEELCQRYSQAEDKGKPIGPLPFASKSLDPNLLMMARTYPLNRIFIVETAHAIEMVEVLSRN